MAEDKKKRFWIPEKEFKELEHEIWNKIDHKNHKQRKFQEKEDDLRFTNIVCTGETIVVIG